MSWRDAAPCRGATFPFYEGVFRNDEDWTLADPEGYAVARAICAECPVRRECAVAVTVEEAGTALDGRDGVYAGMTPAQRWSLERRGTLRCTCGEVRDPLDLVDGRLACSHCHTTRLVPPIPLQGDRWAKRHTTLARKLIGWLIENTTEVDQLPSPSKMVEVLGASIHDIVRVYEGLVADGTLTSRTGETQFPTYYRAGTLNARKRWYDPYLNHNQ